LAREGALKPYTWLNERFDFYHCGICGCITHYERRDRRPDGSDMSAVNLRNIDEPKLISNLPIRLLDGASSWKSLIEAPQPWLLRSPTSDETGSLDNGPENVAHSDGAAPEFKHSARADVRRGRSD
jgi:hypothetical protein